MTDAGTIRYDLLRDAARANPGVQLNTKFVLDLFRAFGVPMTTDSANKLRLRLEADGVLTRVERPGLRYWIAA